MEEQKANWRIGTRCEEKQKRKREKDFILPLTLKAASFE